VPREPSSRRGVVNREAAFHDALVEGADPSKAAPQPPDPWERAILDLAEPIAGQRVLDLGCGTGSLTIHMADAGAASVTGIDVSPVSVSFAEQRAAHFRPAAAIEFRCGSAESTGLPDGEFDLIVGKFVLHHLDFPRGVDELHRLLRPGGRGVFMETSGLNPLLIAGRTHIVHRGRFGALKLGTDDEHPVTRRDLRMLRRRFPGALVDFPIFWMFRPFARQLLASRYPVLGHRIAGLDELFDRHLRSLRWLSYHMRISIQK